MCPSFFCQLAVAGRKSPPRMKTLFKIRTRNFVATAVSILFITLITKIDFAKSAINHLELGAANYAASFGDSEHRFDFLKQTVTEIIARDGKKGIIYLNDIEPTGLKLAQKALRAWFKENGYHQIKIVTLLGDYNTVELPKVHSAHLGNPGTNQLPALEYQSRMNKRIVNGLKRLALVSETGLSITSYYYLATLNPTPITRIHVLAHLARFNPGWSFHETGEYGHSYVLPNGDPASAMFPDVPGIDLRTKKYILRAPAPVSEVCEQKL